MGVKRRLPELLQAVGAAGTTAGVWVWWGWPAALTALSAGVLAVGVWLGNEG